MSDPNPLELTIQSFSAEQLSIKVKNTSSAVLDRSLSIELYVPSYLVNSKVKEAAKAAATNKKPLGVATLAGVVAGPDNWSVWAKRETSDSSVVILLLNDFSQSGTNVSPPVKVTAGAEFIIRIPLNPQASRATVNILYSYLHGTDEKKDKRVDGKLELKWTDTEEWAPDVTLSTNHPNPTMIPAGSVAKIKWHIKDGVSATLRGPLPGGNRELEIKPDPLAEFQMPDGFIEVLVISGMTYILQAQVKRPNNKPNVEVVRMLLLDTDNHQYSYIAPHPRNVLPYGLISIDWAAWGVREAIISVSGHTTRKIPLTQQTLGRFYEGSGIMRVVATREIDNQRTKVETITIKADPAKPMTETVQVTSWIPMEKPAIEGHVSGMAVIAPTMAVLTEFGLYVADVKMDDPTPPLKKLSFNLKQPADVYMNLALTAVDQRFAYLRMHSSNANFEIVPATATGNADEIPPLTLPPDVRPIGSSQGAVIDFVGCDKRVYVVFESPRALGAARLAYSVGFNNGKADLRNEPMLEALHGYRLVTFDSALYVLNRKTGRMFRFDVNTSGKLEPPKQAASAIKKEAQGQSMVADGMLVPVGRVLVVMNPTSVPSVDSLEPYDLQNTLSYTATTSSQDDIPQDLVYNPQRDYWARCGHDIDVKRDTHVAFRGGDSTRLWIIQENNSLQSLAAGDESLFAHDYVTGFPTKTLPTYLNKKRLFKITNNTGMNFLWLNEKHHKAGLTDFRIDGPGEVNSEIPDPFRSGKTEAVEITYNEADPSPVRLRFVADTAPGVKHEYLLEITFSGPDLATATSVFKRLAVNERNAMSAAEIPGTAQQHSPANPLVIAPPKPMVEGVKFRARNATTYQFWREAPGAQRDETSNPYSGQEISITYNTPSFYISAYGAGQLDVNVDFSLAPGIEISSGAQPQTKLVRINTDKSVGLQPELLPNKNETSYECLVTYLRKQEVKGVYIGDGVATERGESIFLPVADASMQIVGRVFKIDPENLSITQSQMILNTGGGVFATPNSIALSNDYIFAMFGNTDMYVLDYSLRILKDKADVTDSFAVVTGIGCAYSNETFLLGVKKDKTTVQNISSHYSLVAKIIGKTSSEKGFATGNSRDVSLDNVKGFREQNRMTGYPAWVSSMTVSPMAPSTSNVTPGGDNVREVAVCIDGGLFVVGKADKPIRVLPLESAGREEDIVFGREGKSIYCLHSQGDNQGLRLSRIDNVTWKQTHGLSLPRGEGVEDLATDTRQRQAGTSYKNYRSASMAIGLDEKLLFVSHGRSIFKVDVANMELRGTFKTELPCRVFHVWWGKPTEASHAVYGTPSSCTLLYAIGARYTGDGINSNNFKTQLYKLAIPD